MDVADAARAIASSAGAKTGYPRMFVTPNIQHIAEMRTNKELRSALQAADIVTCDGFPVAKYARMRGCAIPGRVTGREVTEYLMRHANLADTHRMFFLVDSEETAQAVNRWARSPSQHCACHVVVAPAGFGDDAAYCDMLARQISDFGCTLLFLCVGAPRSELFAARYRNKLPDCWVLCVGQSVRLTLGLNRPPPALVEKLNLEWLWRIMLEPKRMTKRYEIGRAHV